MHTFSPARNVPSLLPTLFAGPLLHVLETATPMCPKQLILTNIISTWLSTFQHQLPKTS